MAQYEYFDKLPLKYAPETGYLMLDVPMPEQLPRRWQHNHRQFKRKPELHVSILNLDAVAASQHVPKDKLLEAARGAFADAPVSFRRFRPPVYECQKDGGTSHSIIVPVEVVGLQAAFHTLALRSNCNLSLPYPHVTLYTAGDEQGIAVKDSMMLALRCQQISAPDLEALLLTSPTTAT